MKTLITNRYWKTFWALLLICGTMTFGSCKKDKYQPKGDYQPKGNYGNASIKSSTITLNNWSNVYDDGVNYLYSSSVSWTEITQAVKDKGTVMAYADDGSGRWQALPYTDAGDDYYSTTINFNYATGSVKFEANGFDDTGSPGTSMFSGLKVKIVAILQEGRMAHPDIDYKNYSEVKKAFNLQD